VHWNKKKKIQFEREGVRGRLVCWVLIDGFDWG